MWRVPVCLRHRNLLPTHLTSLNHLLHFFIAIHVHATQKLNDVCEQVKITYRQVQTIGRVEGTSQAKSASSAHVLVVFTFWMILAHQVIFMFLFLQDIKNCLMFSYTVLNWDSDTLEQHLLYDTCAKIDNINCIKESFALSILVFEFHLHQQIF
jgi:hypothetical protein